MIQTPKLSPCNRFVSLLPNFSWANAKDLWNNMIAKEQYHTRNPLMMSRHPTLQARMRSILMNWLSEVAEVYQLHRETYFLALDYFDRYLSIQNEISKEQLQLVGVTCLFIAAKIEEIYPPKVADFAYLTDGACTEEQILTKELVILKTLKWNLNSMTVNSWLTMYMQLYTIFSKEKPRLTTKTIIERPQQRLSPSKNQPARKRRRTSNSPALQVADTNKQVTITNQTISEDDYDVIKIDCSDDEKSNSSVTTNTTILTTTTNKTNNKKIDDKKELVQTSIKSFISSNLKVNKDADEFMYQKFDPFFYAQIAHLVGLSMLDIGSLRFSYNVISASALYHFSNMLTVVQCTGLKIEQIQECIIWMTPFALAIRDEGFEKLRLNKNFDKSVNLQTHTIELELLDKAHLKCQQVTNEQNTDKTSSSNSNENDSTSKSLSSPLKNSSTILTPPRSATKQNKA